MESAPTDFAVLSIACNPADKHALRITSPGGTSLLTVNAGDTIRIMNPDRPTRDKGQRPWSEIRYLYDLLSLSPMRYPIPDPDPAASPEVPRCASMICGAL